MIGKTKQEQRNTLINRDVVRAQMVLRHLSVKEMCELLNITDTSF